MIFPNDKFTLTGSREPADSASRGSGSTTPRDVIRGESLNTPHTNSIKNSAEKLAFVDYLSFTYRPPEPIFEQFPLRSVLVETFGLCGYNWKLSNSGWNGYTHRIDLDGCGLVAYGGASQNNTVHVQISGQGCAQVPDWLEVMLWGSITNSKITRIDFAHDDLEGNVLNIDRALEWLESGLFNSRGRPPNARFIDDFDSGEGKTLYIGRRKNGKMARIYEKGKELGQQDSPWCRAEVEYRSKDRELNWDSVLNPAGYLSGSYTAFSFLTSEQRKVDTIQRAQSISLDRATHYCSIGYGKLIHLLYELHEGDAEKVLRLLMREGIPPKLKPYFSN